MPSKNVYVPEQKGAQQVVALQEDAELQDADDKSTSLSVHAMAGPNAPHVVWNPANSTRICMVAADGDRTVMVIPVSKRLPYW
jgi:hypothetical protein